MRGDERRFWTWLAIVSALGLLLRVVAVSFASRQLAFNDGLIFHLQANFLADGRGFVDAGRLGFAFVKRPSAQHPPLFPLLLSVVSVAGGRSVLAHQMACAVMSAAAIPLIGLTGREIAGARAGILAAVVAAAYPNLWANDAWVMSESLFVSTIAFVLLASCRCWKQPSLGRATVAGAAIGLAALTRAEAIFLLPLAFAPQCVMQRTVTPKRRAAFVGVACLAAAVVVAPWVIRNLVTFDRPVSLAEDIDSVIGGANCQATYYGSAIGSWSKDCNTENLPAGDESTQGAALRGRGLDYMRAHASRLPRVVVARVGRTWSVFHAFDDAADQRSQWMLWLGVFSFWVLVPVALYGGVISHRLGMSLAPFAGQVVVTTAAAAAGYGLWRLRLPIDVAAITLAGVALAAVFNRRAPSAASAT